MNDSSNSCAAPITLAATEGRAPAIIVLVVVFLVQEFDHDLLSPLIYGNALDIHPVTVLLAVTAGGSLFGVAGGVLAVPVVAVAQNVGSEVLRIKRERRGDAERAEPA